jgi:ribosomal protein S18 acetylase RimI-like enzyme
MSTLKQPVIRHANAADAKKLSVLAEETFRTTFGSMNTVEDMRLHCTSSYSETLQLAEISNTEILTLVCEDGSNLIAFAQLRWPEPPGCVCAKKAGEIQRLYVAQDWHGKGIAQHLMAACFEEMVKRESDLVWLGVWERNPRAISFYQKLGFSEVGAHVFPLGTDPQRDIIMVCAIPHLTN